ncbi:MULTISPECIES: lysine--tRNA ligase [unclassified Kosmotoga]|uniref:lysine--tRNA ligase n=1 Tax=unclassified Kosmotoga TaxID=2631489 RepID=UPI0007C49365|nr:MULTISPECIES: lysine--tRNA ligase [unclassified Kosmotoga]MDI3524066.1 lysyl-tRNA synthetase, class [Kosmotoga sp.]MDK2953485.1 lysyl-tRNA synthetase, class [Kosmotoga sp.]OAA19157.1 lysyl-tRNA synthetase [Kosmotoga sp. DU53]
MNEQIRQHKLNEIEELRSMGIEPYPHHFEKTHSTSDIRKEYDMLQPSETKEDTTISVAGRVMALRHHGKSSFFVLKDSDGRIQAYIRKDSVGDEAFKLFKKYVSIGDFVGVKGFPFKTHTGELSIFVKDFKLLSKAIRTMPEKWHGIKDKEIIYRQRYVEMIASDDAIKRFKIRFELLRRVREFLNARGFIEVETPILHSVTGGASARPFVTHINVFDSDMYLRIAEELYLKRYLVGGFEKIYEIGKNFRNEGMSYKHHPEFVMMELYQAYADYNDIMDLTEDLISTVVEQLTGSTKIVYQGKEIDFAKPWPRIKMADFIKEKLGVDILEDSDERLIEVLEKHNSVPEIKERGHLIEKLWDLVEDDIVQPTFVVEHPVIISPLAKVHREDPRVTERFELIINGMECANAFSELNDPIEQYRRFLHQAGLREAGDAEAQMMDRDFIRALEYGMPPTGGLGIGWDRILMFVTDSPTIRDVIPFPLVRPLSFEEEEKIVTDAEEEES